MARKKFDLEELRMKDKLTNEEERWLFINGYIGVDLDEVLSKNKKIKG